MSFAEWNKGKAYQSALIAFGNKIRPVCLAAYKAGERSGMSVKRHDSAMIHDFEGGLLDLLNGIIRHKLKQEWIIGLGEGFGFGMWRKFSESETSGIIKYSIAIGPITFHRLKSEMEYFGESE